MRHTGFALLLLISVCELYGQQDSAILQKLSFTGDFRFRVEQDWDSRKSDGTYREDRSRLRYRLRFGLNYKHNEWANFGMRLRTGHVENQQDPQITLGTGAKEFSTVPIGLEKLFFGASYEWFSGWVGKNTFPFEKQNELFWSDNVYPEGVFLSARLSSLKLNLGHFIVSSEGGGFKEDQYFQGAQVFTTAWGGRLKLFPSFYYFNKMPNIPDGNDTYTLNYSIFHFGTTIKLVEKPALTLGVDYYNNLSKISQNDSIPERLDDQKQGAVIGLSLGNFNKKGDWTLRAFYTYLERFSAVDFFAQNDWVRWSYSNQNSPAGRLTNFKGLELLAGYMINSNFKLKMRYFTVNQIVSYGEVRETGDRFRLDLDIGF